MDTEPTVSPENEGQRPSSAAAILKSLQSAESSDAFFHDLLRAQVERSEAMHGAVWLGGQPRGEAVRLLCEGPARVSQGAAKAWRAPLARQAAAVFLSGNRHVERVSEPADRLLQGRPYWGLSLPVPMGGTVGAVVTLVLTGSEREVLHYARVAAESVASQGMLYGALQAAQDLQERYEEMCRAWDLVASVNMGYPDPEHMALGFVNKAKEFLGVQRVSLGWPGRGKIKLIAISDQDHIDRRTNLSRALAAAMQEAQGAQKPILYPEADQEPQGEAPGQDEPPDTFRAHAALADLTEDAFIATHPLSAGGEVVAVVAFERQEQRPFSPTEQRLLSIACEQLGPPLGLARQNARGPLARSRDASAALVEGLTGKGHVVAKLIAAAVLALAAAGIFGRWPLKIAGEAELSPAARRVYAAPFDRAILQETLVLPGQLVKAGDTLFRFDTEELEIATREAQSKLAATKKQMAVYFSEQKIAQYKIAKAQCEELAAQIELLEHRIRQGEVRATFDGIVLTGDLRQHIGTPFPMGQTLLEVAPLDELLLLLEVDQGDVAFVEVGQRGTFVTKARPDVTLDFVVEKIRPMSEARDQANVFIVEARVKNAKGWLRPGMEAAANVRAGTHNLAWVFTRKLVNWLRFKLLF